MGLLMQRLHANFRHSPELCLTKQKKGNENNVLQN